MLISANSTAAPIRRIDGSASKSTPKVITLDSQAVSAEAVHQVAIRPNAAPMPASISPSTTSCCTIWRRPPPSACRTAISLRRAAPRASSRLARFRQATASTSPAISVSSPATAVNGPSLWGRELTDMRGRPEIGERPIAIGPRILRVEALREQIERGRRRGRSHAGFRRAGKVQRVVLTFAQPAVAVLEHRVGDRLV